MRRNLVSLIAGLMLTLGGTGVCNASLVVTWSDVGGDLNLSINGTWSSWNSGTTVLISSTDSLLFDDNGSTTQAFNLSRGIGGSGQSVFMDIRSGSGSVTAPDFSFGPPLPTTGYTLVHFSEGGIVALQAVGNLGSTLTINESFNLGSTFTLSPGTRTFSSSIAPGDTLTMNYVSSVPLPAAAWLFISALGGLVVAKRKQLKV